MPTAPTSPAPRRSAAPCRRCSRRAASSRAPTRSCRRRAGYRYVQQPHHRRPAGRLYGQPELHRHRREPDPHGRCSAAAGGARPDRQPVQRRERAQQFLQQRRHAAAELSNVFGLTGSNLANALTQLSGEAATGAQQGAFQLMDQFLGLMLDPFVDGRSGVAAPAGPRSALRPSARRCRRTSRSLMPRW